MISASGLTKRFHQRQADVLAVDDLSFTVEPGEVYGLLGPNGAGKTTTLRMIVGLLKPDEGFTEVSGYRTSDAPDEVKARIGLVSAGDGVYPWLSVRETLLFFADLYGMSPDDAKAQVRKLGKLLGISEILDRRTVHLSTGQRQRVTLARALIHDPPVMLLDEPTRGLDVIGSKLVFDYIDQLRGDGKAVIVSTHRLDEAQRLCDRFGLLHKGRLLHEGSLSELQTRTGHESLVEMFLQFVSPSFSAV